jgi:hypothetical protein
MTTDDAIIPTELRHGSWAAFATPWIPKPIPASGSRKGRSLRAPSGARADRPELAKVIRRLEASDVLLVTRLDRLARSTRDLLNILDAIAKAGAGFKSLKDAWADTTTPHGRLMLTVLGGSCRIRA